MICVLEVIEGPARGKRIWLKENQSLEVGRVSTADFSIPSDSHLSRRHLLLESIVNGFRVRDVGSSNGTFVNNAKISAVELQTGDIVRAGMTVLSVSIRNDGENPHDPDGVSFSQSITKQSQGAPVSELEGNGSIRTMEGLDKFDFESTVRIPATEPQTAQCLPDSLPKEPADGGLGHAIWWKRYYKPTAAVGVFEQTSLFEGINGNLAGLVLEFAKEFKIVAIVNQSQLEPDGVKFLQHLYEAGKIETISWSLCLVKLDDHPSLIQLVEHCEGHDAMVVIGRRTRLELAELKPYANSLSYPSMFSKHVFDQDASLRRTLLKNDVLALFEPNRDGKTGLLING